jgi:hypothetical protein
MSLNLTKLDKLKLTSKVVKAASLTATGSAVIGGVNEYITLMILIAGSTADAVISFIKEKEAKNEIDNNSTGK